MALLLASMLSAGAGAGLSVRSLILAPPGNILAPPGNSILDPPETFARVPPVHAAKVLAVEGEDVEKGLFAPVIDAAVAGSVARSEALR